MLTLMEEILLLALNDEKGTLSLASSTGIDYCLTGAILMELELLKRIRVEKKSLEVISRTPTNNPRFDNALKQIDSSKRIHPPHYWVSKLRSTIKGLRKELLEELVDKALLREEDHQYLLFFTTTRYPLRDPRTKKDILDRLQKVLLRGESPDPRTLKLIGLVNACSLTNKLVDKEDRKYARKKAKETSKEDILAEAVKKVIQASASAAYAGGS
jgi:golgi phosphoprotein 3